MRRALQRWLAARKFRVSTAIDCASAIRRVIADPPDVILLDVKLAGGDDGLALPKVLADIGSETPFVVFTGSSGPRVGFEARHLGAFAVIEKPALPDEIAAAHALSCRPQDGKILKGGCGGFSVRSLRCLATLAQWLSKMEA